MFIDCQKCLLPYFFFGFALHTLNLFHSLLLTAEWSAFQSNLHHNSTVLTSSFLQSHTHITFDPQFSTVFAFACSSFTYHAFSHLFVLNELALILFCLLRNYSFLTSQDIYINILFPVLLGSTDPLTTYGIAAM